MDELPGEFKPNIYPVMYWALAYGVIAGVILLVVYLLSQYITVIWFPVFLIGLVWGGYRNYIKQKQSYLSGQGMEYKPQSPMAEFRAATQDIMNASREMMAEQQAEDAAAIQAEEDALAAEEAQYTQETPPPEEPYQDDPQQPPRPPQQPPVV